MNILLTGGAGYIGSHTVIELIGEHHNVVAALKVVEWVPLGHFLQLHAGVAVIHDGNETPALASGFQLAAPLLESGVKLWETTPKIVSCAFEIFVGYKQLLLHILLLYCIACLTGQDDKLAHHIGAAEVYSRVWLAVALLLRTAHRLRERHIGTYLVEDEVEGAAEYGFYLEYLVAGVHKVVDGADDGESGANICLIAELNTTA